jgi:hypothetical protein
MAVFEEKLHDGVIALGIPPPDANEPVTFKQARSPAHALTFQPRPARRSCSSRAR